MPALQPYVAVQFVGKPSQATHWGEHGEQVFGTDKLIYWPSGHAISHVLNPWYL